VNVVEIFCTQVLKLKNETCWNYSMNGRRGNKNDVRGEFNYNILYKPLEMSQCTPSAAIINKKKNKSGIEGDRRKINRRNSDASLLTDVLNLPCIPYLLPEECVVLGRLLSVL
jgi:hypothetical protein